MPGTPDIRRFGTAAELGRALAAHICDAVETGVRERGRFLLGCPGGRTPVSTYAALAEEFAARDLDLSGLVIAMMDDYVEWDGTAWAHIDAEAHNSCRRFARQEIQAVVNRGARPGRGIRDENVWFPDPSVPGAYDNRLRAAGGIDFFILASGAGDGHVAFNPPGSMARSRSRIVRLAEQTRRDNLGTFPQFTDLDDVPTHGVTVGIATIADLSKAAAMILIGADKREAFGQLTAGSSYDPAWPATVYHLIDGAALWVDASAGGTSP